MSKQLRALLERKNKAVAAAKALNDEAATEKRDLTDEERTQVDAHLAGIATLNGDIERQRALDSAEASMAGVDVASDSRVTVDGPNVLKDPKWGFSSFGEYCREVKAAGQPGGSPSERLALVAAAPSTYGSEGSGQDGGFLVPPEFASQVFTHSLEGDALLPMTDNVPVSGNSMVFPKDETTPWGTDGIRAYWESEAAAATATKPKGGTSTLRLHKLFSLVPVTDELGEDAPALSAYLERKMGDSVRWKSNDGLVNGSGAGMPLGILNAGALVSVAKETGQAADTVKVDNVAKMFARMPGGAIGRAVWLINNDVLPQLITMQIGSFPVFTPPGAVQNAPAGLLLG
ncbi:MAG: phage major capsid protein, partial [Dongiaceae bacterium]